MSEYIIDMSNSSYQSASGLSCADVSQIREEIVRCQNCVYFERWEYTDGTTRNVCERFEFLDVTPDGFCAWGERHDP